MVNSMNFENTMGIYIHIPFCVKKCNYCDFISFTKNTDSHNEYIDKLILEINSQTIEKKVTSIFFGGGTPSILKEGSISKVMTALRKKFIIDDNCEITIECNPGTLTKNKLKEYKECGINRLSIGLQSTDDKDLKLLGRIHTYDNFLDSFFSAREFGFNNINIDIISSIPGQTLSSYKEGLSKILQLSPEHISAYSLIIEENTMFYQLLKNNSFNGIDYPRLPSEEEERDIYYYTQECLKDNNYSRYEISNYSVPGKESIHNTGYWQLKNYLGLGLNSSSFIDGARYKNTDSLEKYIKNSYDHNLIQEDFSILTTEDLMSEFIFLGLRMTKGIDQLQFKEFFSIDINNIFKTELDKMISEKLISKDDNYIKLTSKGVDVSNYVLSNFIL